MNDKEKEQNITTVDVMKSKVDKPFGQAKFPIEWGKGISRSKEVLAYAEELNIVKRSGSYYSYGEIKLGNGIVAAITLLEDNPELLDELYQKVMSLLTEEPKEESEASVGEVMKAIKEGLNLIGETPAEPLTEEATI